MNTIATMLYHVQILFSHPKKAGARTTGLHSLTVFHLSSREEGAFHTIQMGLMGLTCAGILEVDVFVCFFWYASENLHAIHVQILIH